MMKHSQHTTPVGTATTVLDVVRWAEDLARLHARIAPRFARPEPRRRALAYLKGLLSATPRKNSWQIAEHAREAQPTGMQRLLASAVWDEGLVRDDLREYVLEQLGDPLAILALDETSFPKHGRKSAGVRRQYCGTTKRPENCQVGVFLSYVSKKGHTLLDRELYIPKRWFDDRQRCREAGIPETTCFHTKCELARTMLERVCQAQMPISWVVADTVYGSNQDLRDWLELHGSHYVLAVACDEPVEIMTLQGRTRMTVTQAEVRFLQAHDWHQLSMGNGTKGPRCFDWACLPMLHSCQDDGHHWVLIRRSCTDPTDKAYYFVFGPLGTTLSTMVEVIAARWPIEEDFENAKALGLDEYEVRTWTAWYRHITLVMLAQAVLSGICAQELVRQASVQDSQLLPLTRPEVGHLLGQLLWPHPHNASLLLAWSWWRRCHRSLACFSHSKRRREKG
jgi:SRSO17 transposase